MKPRIVEESGFSVIGIAARTSNRQEKGDGVIAKQWARFFKEGILEKIPKRADSNIIAVYCDYASDRNGEYTSLLGARSAGVAPPGMAMKHIAKGRYAVYTTARGPVGKVVSEAWQQIWGLEDAFELGGKRTYQTDFELYDERSRNPQESQVDIYVGIR